MHEVSIALNILEVITGQCVREGYGKIVAVSLKIGRASGIMPDALTFAFDVVKGESIASGAVLEIEEVPVSGRCNTCSCSFITEDEYVLACPECGSESFVINTGRELDITDMEVS